MQSSSKDSQALHQSQTCRLWALQSCLAHPTPLPYPVPGPKSWGYEDPHILEEDFKKKREKVIVKPVQVASVGGDLCYTLNEFPVRMTSNLNVISRATGRKNRRMTE